MNRIRSILACVLAALFVAAAPAWCCCASPRTQSCHDSSTLAEADAQPRSCCAGSDDSAPRRTDSKKCCPTDAPNKCCGKDADKASRCGVSSTCQSDARQTRSTWNAKPTAYLTPIELATLALPAPPWVAPLVRPASAPRPIDISWIVAPGSSLLTLGCMLTI